MKLEKKRKNGFKEDALDSAVRPDLDVFTVFQPGPFDDLEFLTQVNPREVSKDEELTHEVKPMRSG